MQQYSVVSTDPARSNPMRRMQTWIQRFICGVRPPQLVVGNRIDHISNALVTQAQFNVQDRAAQVCPFVQESISRDEYWLEESLLTNQDQNAIEDLLTHQIAQFLATPPAFDPMGTGQPLPTPDNAIYKTFMTIFPNVTQTTGALQLFDDIHAHLKPTFMHRGLMLGQFYHGCPVGQGPVYNPNNYQGVILSSPIPAFAIRYMVRQDAIFNTGPGTAAGIAAAHHRYFP